MGENTVAKTEFTGKNIILFIFACIGACLCGINVSGIAALFTEVQADLNIGEVDAGWILSIYSLITYPSMILIGRIGDLIGFKKAVILSCLTFAVGSVGVAVSSSIAPIIIFRAVQAIGGGGLPTASMSLVAKIFPTNRQKMMGLAVNVFPLAQIIGSNYGVLIARLTGSWRGIYWVNVVLMVISIILFLLFMPKSEKSSDVSWRQIDFLGAGLMCAAVCCLMEAITQLKEFGQELGRSSSTGMIWLKMGLWFAGFVILGVLFIIRVKKAKHPIVDREVLFNKKFASVTAFFFVYGFVALGMAQMIPSFAQKVYGFNSDMAAFVVMAKGIGWFLVGLIVAALIKKLGYRYPLLICIFIIAASYILFAILSKNTFPQPAGLSDYAKGFWWLFLLAAVLGAGSGMASPTMTNCAVDLMPENVGTIYGVTAAFRQIGSTLCVPIVTVIVALSGKTGDASGAAHGFRISFLLMAALILICLAFVFKMPAKPSDPEHLRKGGH